MRNGKIDAETIDNAYRCKAGTTFDSYAMQGKRPIIAIGLDEYYKYVLPVTQPWKDQEGNMVTANYLYACQGDRILSRELLIENRLLYMDSKWLGGTFGISTGGMAGANFRSTGNKPSTSSDIYLDGKVWNAEANAYVDDPNAVYPVPYYDATPEYMVTPYLNFYVTTFVDENTFQAAEAYNEAKYPNGIPTIVSPSVAEGYRTGKVDQQLNYFAGSKYISSFGDLSLKYLNEIHFPSTPRLLDITLGSDAPGYFNNEKLNPLELDTEVNADGTVKAGHEKSLLRKIILTNVKGVDTYLDVRSPNKLEEFRALGTSLRYALFADGAPLNTVHLPNTVTQLAFTQNKELKKLITSTPVVADMTVNAETGKNELVYRPHESYEGLFVDGVTNYTPNLAGTGSPITEISFDGDALGYGSYTILKNIVDLKNGTGRANRLKIRMADVTWTPYVQVEYGESKLASTEYYYLTDHSTYEPYDHDDSLWYEDTLNGKVYTYNSDMDESIIQDIGLLRLFYEDKENTPSNEINQFTNNVESMMNQQTYPTISGEIYISNAEGEAIKESDLTDIYGKAFPNLKIRVANVDPAYIAKFVQILDNGKEEEVDIIRYKRKDGAEVTLTEKIPYKQYCDFLGWGLTKAPSKDADWFIKYDYENKAYGNILNPQLFSDSKNVVVLYAIFQEHPYIVSFKNPDGQIFETTQSTYGQAAKAPMIVPSITDSSLAFNEVYKFKGYSREMVPLNANDRQISQAIVPLNTIYVTHDMDLWAVYKKQSVYDEPFSTEYFDFSPYTYTESQLGQAGPAGLGENGSVSGYQIDIKPGVELSGKITLPSYYNDTPILSIGSSFKFADDNGFGRGRYITHVFWYETEEKPCQLKIISSEAFRSVNNSNYVSNLKYFEFPASLRVVGTRAFQFAKSLDLSLFQLPSNLLMILQSSFANAFDSGSATALFKIPSSVAEIAQYSFNNIRGAIAAIQIGEKEKGSHLRIIMTGDLMTDTASVQDSVISFSSGAVPSELSF